MKIRLAVSEEKEKEIKDFLQNLGIEIDDSASLLLSETSHYVTSLPVRSMDKETKCYIQTGSIIFIESYGHDIYVHCDNNNYITNDPIRQLEYLLDPLRFIRISSSVIVSRMHIKEIRPSLYRKFTLVMSDGTLLDVTRSYYSYFREQFKI